MFLPGLELLSDLDSLPWQETRRAGVSWIPLHLEPADPARDAGAVRSGKGAVVLIRMEPGAGYAPHRHVGSEEVLVLRGGYRDADGEHVAGEFVHYDAGSVHAPQALGEASRPVGEDNPACILYSVVPQGIELLDSA